LIVPGVAGPAAHVLTMNLRPFIVLVDIDAPLALWEEGLVATTRRHFPHVNTADAGTRLEWDLTVGLTEEEKAAVSDVMQMPGFYRDLEPVEGAVHALHEMLNLGIEVFLCSTPSLDNPTCASDKLAWLDEHFGREITKRTILTQDKTLVQGDVLIDDKPKISGHLTPSWKHVIFDRAYNQGVPGPRLTGWAQWRDVLELALQDQVAA
jgi:5'-nucleotidase